MTEPSSVAVGGEPGPIALATDVGAWRVLEPVLRELWRRAWPIRVFLAEPAATVARREGVPFVALEGPTPEDRADEVLKARPTVLLLGTSAKAVAERALMRRLRASPNPARARAPSAVDRLPPPLPLRQTREPGDMAGLHGGGWPGRPSTPTPADVGAGRVRPRPADAVPSVPTGPAIPTLAVLDAMLFVERRFGPGLAELADLVACPDAATVDRLRRAGAPADRLAVTGNPTLEEIAAGAPSPVPPVVPDRPVDVLFASSPVKEMRLRDVDFAIDETESLQDVLAALAALRAHAPAGFRVRVRLHPVQEPEALPAAPPGIELVLDDDPDRLRSCARARVVVGLSSSLLGEARLLPRAAVAYLPGPFWHQERAFAPEYDVRLARDRLELHGLLERALSESPSLAPRDLHVGASGRIADLLASLARAAR